jgi:hypothetical protein
MNASCFCVTNGCRTAVLWVCKLQSNERALFIQHLFLFGGLTFLLVDPIFLVNFQPSCFCYFSFVKLRWISERLVLLIGDRKDHQCLERLKAEQLKAERQEKINELKEKTNNYITQQLIHVRI